MMKILMVCLGNICRSPLAEGLLKHKAKQNNLDITVDSCGFEYDHLGCQPDYRSIEVARKHGIDITDQKARLFQPSFFDEYDKILVMDKNNYNMVAAKARNDSDMDKVDFIMNVVHHGKNIHVPDPYWGRSSHFMETWHMLDQATDKIIDLIQTNKWH